MLEGFPVRRGDDPKGGTALRLDIDSGDAGGVQEFNVELLAGLQKEASFARRALFPAHQAGSLLRRTPTRRHAFDDDDAPDLGRTLTAPRRAYGGQDQRQDNET
ncbi:MAG: hypothetical protein CL938_03980 [Deltaproteobacteria bacterium]|jgi:hypothetical protein|nr:hypothetical protein [Deltaproteobacteria bacterium]